MAGWLREQVHAAGARGIVVGLSGGVDSAVVARVAQMAVPDGLMTVIMPAHSNPQDAEDARLVAGAFNLPVMTVDLSRPVDAMLLQIQQALGTWPPGGAPGDDKVSRLALANLKPRLRMATLYYVANRLNYLVAGTGNRSEIAIGYYTKYGDGGVDLLPLGALVKSEVRQLAHDLGVPGKIIKKAPAPACGSDRPTRARWASPTRNSRVTCARGRLADAGNGDEDRAPRARQRAQAPADAGVRTGARGVGGGAGPSYGASSAARRAPSVRPKCSQTLMKCSDGAIRGSQMPR